MQAGEWRLSLGLGERIAERRGGEINDLYPDIPYEFSILRVSVIFTGW